MTNLITERVVEGKFDDSPLSSPFGDIFQVVWVVPIHIKSSDLKLSGASWCTSSFSPVKELSGLAMWFARLDATLDGRDAIICNDGAATGCVAGCSGPANFSFAASCH